MIMKKYMSLLLLALLSSSLHATRITLKDGNCVDVPDEIRIENDLGSDAVVNKTIGWIDGYFTNEHSLPKSQHCVIQGAQVLDELKVKVNGVEYKLIYPLVTTFRNQIVHAYDVNSDITSEFTYKLSALIGTASHILVSEKQETVLWIDKSLKS
jgi:hypothetical protein